MEIAYNLRMPLYVLLEEMPYEELQEWVAYFNSRPVGWREDDRAYKLLQAQGVKQKAWDLFPSLGPIYKPKAHAGTDGRIDVNAFKKSLIFSKIVHASGGEALSIWDE